MVFDVNSTPTEFLSQSEQSEMLINFYLEDMMSVNNKCILFIDNFGQEFSDYKFKEILHKVINKVKNKDITIITTSKNEIDIDQSIVKKFYLKNRKLKDQVNLDDYVLSISNVMDMDELERLYSQNEILLMKEKIYFENSDLIQNFIISNQEGEKYFISKEKIKKDEKILLEALDKNFK